MKIELLDWIVVFAYIFFVFVLAVRASRQEGGSGASVDFAKEKYLANNDITFVESLCSIIATEVSALTFLGIPAFAFNKNFSFVQIYIGAILGRLLVALVFLPKVYGRGLTIYEVMAQRLGEPAGQRAVSLFYLMSKVLSVGVRLFSGAILVAHFFHLNIYLGLGLVTFVTFLYTLIGGLKAVVRTDILQMALFIFGGVMAHYLIPQVAEQSWGSMMSLAHEAGKTNLYLAGEPWGLLIGLLGGVLFDMATHGVDQDFAQRLMASQSLKKAQWAIFLSSFISISVGLLFLSIGALLWSFYQSHPFPADLQNADHLFAHFIVTYFPTGVKGLMVAGVLAATMSTLDSTINALGACLHNDIFSKRDLTKIKKYVFVDTLVITLLLFSVAVLSSKYEGLLLLGLKIQSWTAGPLLGIFFVKVVFDRYFPFPLTSGLVLMSYLFGLSGVALNVFVINWDWNLNVYFGCLASLLGITLYQRVKNLT